MESQVQSKSPHSREKVNKNSQAQKNRQGPSPEKQPAGLHSLDSLVANPDLLQPEDVPSVQRTAGNQAAVTLIQAKLMVGPAVDFYEQEADLIAGQVASASMDQAQPLASAVTPLVQRQADGNGIEVEGELEAHLRAGKSSGAPLPDGVRFEMEERFGSDFSGVRLHTGIQAADLNRDLHARAFTHERDIFLGQNAADPATHEGKRLLAHELTHVIQQTGASAAEAPVQRLRETDDDDFRLAMRLRRRAFAPEEEDSRPVNLSRDDSFLSAMRHRRQAIAPEDEDTIEDYNQRIGAEDLDNQVFAKKRITQRNEELKGIGRLGATRLGIPALRNKDLREEAARNRQSGWLEGDTTGLATAWGGYLGSGLSLGGSISGTVNAFHSEDAAAGYAGSGLGIAGSAVSGISSGFQLATSAAKLDRARRLMNSRSRGARMLGKDLADEGVQGSAESSLGLINSLFGIGTNVSGIFTTQDSNNQAAQTSNQVLGTIGAGVGMIGEGVSQYGTGKKWAGGAARSLAASKFDTKDTELAAIAANTKKGQKGTGSFLGNLFKGAMNVGSNILGIASAFTTGDTKAYLSLAGTISGGVGAASGMAQTEIERYQGTKIKAQAATDAAKLTAKIQAGDAGAVKFAADVLQIREADKLAEEDPETLNELISSRMTQYTA